MSADNNTAGHRCEHAAQRERAANGRAEAHLRGQHEQLALQIAEHRPRPVDEAGAHRPEQPLVHLRAKHLAVRTHAVLGAEGADGAAEVAEVVEEGATHDGVQVDHAERAAAREVEEHVRDLGVAAGGEGVSRQ